MTDLVVWLHVLGCAWPGQELPPCVDDVDQVAWKGHIYRTLYGAKVEGETPTSCEETSYQEMPENYSLAPDEVSIVSHVIAAHKWGIYRVCLETGCYGTKHAKTGEVGEQLNNGQFWEMDAGKYKVKEACAGENYHRLLVRQQCQAGVRKPGFRHCRLPT